MHWILVALIQCGMWGCYQTYQSPPMSKADCLEMAAHYNVPPEYRAKSSVNCQPAK